MCVNIAAFASISNFFYWIRMDFIFNFEIRSDLVHYSTVIRFGCSTISRQYHISRPNLDCFPRRHDFDSLVHDCKQPIQFTNHQEFKL
ncbi:hypothetical protein VNO77_02368 [Canavalia gladiata]|uniref:Uncharacterized protein n=1 Tax=Canavalia gladiata TaxID=3824 RepID=A0AAN9R762_CANGL